MIETETFLSKELFIINELEDDEQRLAFEIVSMNSLESLSDESWKNRTFIECAFSERVEVFFSMLVDAGIINENMILYPIAESNPESVFNHLGINDYVYTGRGWLSYR